MMSIVVLIDMFLFAGGGCGYSGTNLYPFNSMTSCGDRNVFRDGKGCGSCYQVYYYVKHAYSSPCLLAVDSSVVCV
jgi:hypothetical protein